MDTYNKYYNNKSKNKFIGKIITKVLISIIFLLISIIFIKSGNDNKNLYEKVFLNDSISFTISIASIF